MSAARHGVCAVSSRMLAACRHVLALAVITGFAVGWTDVLAAQGDPEAGRVVYEKWCAGCHGDTGAGDGVGSTYMFPRPRDFTTGVYQVRTTASGELPTDDDLRHVVDNGMPGTTMPAWRSKLTAQQRDNVITYIKTFSRFFQGASPQAVAPSRAPGGPSQEDLDRGRTLYEDELQCLRCHGNAGRGDGTSAPTLTDDPGFPIRAADLTHNWLFNGGGRVEDIFMRMRTGLDGTPMPSNWDVVEAGIITEEDLWRVAQYVRSLSPAQTPQRRDVIRAARVEGALPTGPDDAAWDGIERFYVPLVGQITVAPRWFAPSVDAIFVQAVHNGAQLSLRLTWDDRTRSPDPAWQEYFDGITRMLAAPDSAHNAAQGPDRVVVQFPLTLPEGTRLPYFLRGDPQQPVYVMRWMSDPDQIESGTARGFGTFAAGGGSEITHAASFAEGQWRLQLTRSLTPADSTVATSFPEGRAIPIAFSAADGTQGEDDVRGSVSAWYSIYLDIPTPPRVYIAPVIAAILTAALGMVIVWRAQHQRRGPIGPSSEE
jgi:mono/diheme cytochrome c family protein